MSKILYPFQAEAVSSVLDYFITYAKKGNPLVCMPTGTGKSLVIADLIRTILMHWPNQRLGMFTHVHTLIQQNADELLEHWPGAPLGICSSGLSKNDYHMPVVYGGIQTLVNIDPSKLGWYDMIFIDEAHMIGDNDSSMYLTLLKSLKLINPKLKIVGFSATPYRMKMGMLTEGGIFTDICFNITDYKSFNRLVDERYLAPLVGRPGKASIDPSKLKIVNGDFNKTQSQSAIDAIIWDGCEEIIELAHDRRAWMGFAAGVENAEKIATTLQAMGIVAEAVHSKRKVKENDARLEAYKRGEIRAIVGANKLTTGFNYRPIDFIFDMQPTRATNKHVQKGGRGTRTSVETGKTDCLYADFCQNVITCGPFNDPRLPRKPGEGGGEAPVRICEGCGVYNHASVRFCHFCGKEFDFKIKINTYVGSAPVMRIDEPPIITKTVVRNVIYKYHESKAGKPTMKVTYHCGDLGQPITEWISIEHEGHARVRAFDWWRQRTDLNMPETVSEALKLTDYLKKPTYLNVHVNKKPYPEIKGYEYAV